jgi:hypothetical protein
MSDELDLKIHEAKLKTLEYLWKLADSSFEKNFRMASLTLAGNAAALALCLTIFKDFRDRIATDALAGAGYFFCIGMIASAVMLALTWLIAEIGGLLHARVAANDFSDESFEEYKKAQLAFYLPDKKHLFKPTATLAGIVMAIPYLVSVLCFFTGVIKIANKMTCMFACS